LYSQDEAGDVEEDEEGLDVSQAESTIVSFVGFISCGKEFTMCAWIVSQQGLHNYIVCP